VRAFNVWLATADNHRSSTSDFGDNCSDRGFTLVMVDPGEFTRGADDDHALGPIIEQSTGGSSHGLLVYSQVLF